MSTRRTAEAKPQQESPDRTIKIGGKSYQLRFGIRAQSALKDHWGITPDPIGVEGRKSGDQKLSERLGALEMEDTVTVVWAALRKHHPELTHEDVLDLLDSAGLDGLTETLTDLIGASTPVIPDDGKKKTESPASR